MGHPKHCFGLTRSQAICSDVLDLSAASHRLQSSPQPSLLLLVELACQTLAESNFPLFHRSCFRTLLLSLECHHLTQRLFGPSLLLTAWTLLFPACCGSALGLQPRCCVTLDTFSRHPSSDCVLSSICVQLFAVTLAYYEPQLSSQLLHLTP